MLRCLEGRLLWHSPVELAWWVLFAYKTTYYKEEPASSEHTWGQKVTKWVALIQGAWSGHYIVSSYDYSVPETGLAFAVSNSYTCDVFLQTWAKTFMSKWKEFRLYFNYLSFCTFSLLDPYIQRQRSHLQMRCSMIWRKKLESSSRLSYFTVK